MVETKTVLVEAMPLLPLRDVVVFPYMVVPLFVGRPQSILALEAAVAGSKKILLVAQKEATVDTPTTQDLYTVGTISNILQLLKLPDGTIKVLIEGLQRGKIKNYIEPTSYMRVEVEWSETLVTTEILEIEILLRSLFSQFDQYIKLYKKTPSEILNSLSNIQDPIRLVDTIITHMSLRVVDKQKVLESIDIKTRIEHVMALLESEIDLLQVERRIRGNVKKQMEKTHREYYLHEQMKAIQKELGSLGGILGSGSENSGPVLNEHDALIKKIEQSGMSKEALQKTLTEANKLKIMPPMSAEATITRNYVDWMLAVPWQEVPKSKINLSKAEAVLDEDHFGLEKVKERIVEYLAVQRRVQKIKGPVLCLIGPPGVGKTSLGKSIARATQRPFVRISLGGVRDEAEIRGHRRTYIGSMPGKILQKLAKVGVKNPLFLLDEVDKMAMDYRGDPAAALLEVLDPEQNNTFNDHYLEVDYDLSDVMFIATANSLDIPAPLLDRMEVIRIAGYTEEEKFNIATKYLIPKQQQSTGLKAEELVFTNEAIVDIIRYYTREAGVRNLEREIAKICRKVVKSLFTNNSEVKSYAIDANTLEQYLGVRKYRFGQIETLDRIGHVIGLAWTEVGGEILTIEAQAIPGKGNILRTGKLGDVMQESIQAAMTVVRSRAQSLGFAPDFYEKYDVHIHVPEGATPKDGPSAGISMCTAIVSMFTGIPVKHNIAMTGEITLRGQVLPIGGLKEKLLAARRAGITEVIIPKENLCDLKEIPENIYTGMKIFPVEWIEEVLNLALLHKPKPKPLVTSPASRLVGTVEADA